MKLKKDIGIFKSFFEGKVLGKKIPLCVELRITDRCNYGCRYCNTKQQKKEMTKDEIFRIIDLISDKVAHINISGGEPLLRDDIGEIISYIKSKHIYLTLITNGSLVRDRINDLRKLNLLVVSLDGPEELNDNQRGVGSYKKAIDAVKIAKKNNIKVNLAAVITKKSLRCVRGILNISNELNAPIIFQPFSSFNLGYDLSSDLRMTENDKGLFYNEIMKYSKDYLIGMSNHALKFLFQGDYFQKSKCYAGLLHFRIEPNGDIFSCLREVFMKDGNNIFRNGFWKALRDTKKVNCDTCWCSCTAEWNGFLSLKYNSLASLFRYLKNGSK